MNTISMSKIKSLIYRFTFARVITLFVCCSLLAACGGGDESEAGSAPPPAPPSKYKFHAINQTGGTIRNLLIQGMAMPVKFTKLTSGSSKSLLGPTMKLPGKLTVSWTDERNQRRSTKISVGSNIPSNFNGSMYFTVKGIKTVDFRAGTYPK